MSEQTSEHFETTEHHRYDILGLCTTVLLTAISLFFLLRLWTFHPHVPITYEGDGLLTLSAFRNIQLSNWYLTSQNLGYPFGQFLQDFPAIADGLSLLYAWMLVKILRDPVLAFNFFYLSSYLLVAAGAYVGCRIMTMKRELSIGVALLFAFLPYHWMHGAGHLFLSMYPLVAISIAVLIRELTRPEAENEGAISLPRRSVPYVLLGLAIGASGLYYAVFFLVILATAIFMKVSSSGLCTRAWMMFSIGMGTVVSLAAQFAHIFIWQQRHGPNLDTVKRGAFEVEYYSLRLIDLLRPIPQHRLNFMSNFGTKSVSNYVPGEATAFLGTIGAVGIVIILMSLLSTRPDPPMGTILGPLSRLFLVLFVASSVGGLNQVIATLGFAQIRVWSRSSVFLGFMSLVAFFLLIERLMRNKSSAALTLVVGVIVLVGILDTNRVIPRDAYSKTSNEWHNDRKLIAEIEKMFGPGARVLQLPVLKFPEQGPTLGIQDYAQLRGQLHSASLCWSYGAVQGRDNGRTVRWKGTSVAGILAEARTSGFDAVWVDLPAFADGGTDESSQVAAVTGASVLEDSLHRVRVFDLRTDRSQKRLSCQD